MYGETDVMRHRVGQLREQSADIRRLADQLVGQTDRIAWTGRAADAMRERARQRATALRECAQRYESAADALDRHADDVDRLKDAIAQRERKAGALVEDARAREREIRLGAEDYADEILNTLEVNLSKFIAAVQRGRERLQGKDEPAEVS